MILRLLAVVLIAGCSDDWPKEVPKDTPAKFRKLESLHERLGAPGSGDWLDRHKESGQTYTEYVRGGPIRPTKDRRTIYIQPLGAFTPAQRKIIDQTAKFLGIYYELPVKVSKDLGLDIIPERARRVHPTWKDKQILTGYVLDEVLRPRLPRDAVAYIAFTASDLWPGAGWNFVFGQASLRERVGVWSIYRNGDPTKDEATRLLCLKRTLKTASHELGHMFSIEHCIYFECNLCGCNHREESDRRPLALCPVCLAKLCHATGADPVKRFEKLVSFAGENGLKESQKFWEKSLKALKGE